MARPGFRQHRKFRRLVSMLGLPEPYVLGHVEMMWSVAYENGDPVLGDDVDVELAAGWSAAGGEPTAFCRAALECGGSGGAGLIEFCPNSTSLYQVHDLWHHAPDYVQSRFQKEKERRIQKTCAHCGGPFHSPDHRAMFCTKACRQANYRQRSVTDCNGDDRNALRNETDSNDSPAPAPAPAPELEKLKTSAPSPADAGSLPAPGSPVFECEGPEKHWQPTGVLMTTWSAAYPSIDLESELRKALAWIASNPSRRKTAKGMPRFITNWLNRETDKRRSSPVSEAEAWAIRDGARIRAIP